MIMKIINQKMNKMKMLLMKITDNQLLNSKIKFRNLKNNNKIRLMIKISSI